MVMGWIFGGVGYHATSKGVELSYNIGYFITEALFCPICTIRSIHPVHPDIIHILWISMFHGHYLHFVDIPVFREYYLHIVDTGRVMSP